MDQAISPPIEHWSYSAMSQLLRNPLAFKKKYILKVYDDAISPSGLIGTALHKAVELYYKGLEPADAIAEGLKKIEQTSDYEINYGKTGNRQKMIENFTKAINWWFEEEPKHHEILAVEESILDWIEINGKRLPLPAKAKIDIVRRNAKGELEIYDHKFISRYSDPDVDNFNHWLQSQFNYHLVKAKYGEAPARMIYGELKIAKNKDNTPQLQPYTIEFDDQKLRQDTAIFADLYMATTVDISQPGKRYLPNPGDLFDGQASFDAYRTGVIGTEQVIQVKHKTEQVAFKEKDYTGSKFEQAGAEAYSDEEKIRLKLQEFGVGSEIRDTFKGPTTTKVTLKINRGVPMSKIAKMTEDIAIATGAEKVRIEAPIRGTDLVGIELPSKARKTVHWSENLLRPGTSEIPIGVDVYGETHYRDIQKMPHALIAGQTGSGKSVFINALLTQIIKQKAPVEVMAIDPKQVELQPFADHFSAFATSIEDSEKLLDDLVDEMEGRYKIMAKEKRRTWHGAPTILIVDEFADLMLSGGQKPRKFTNADGEKDELPSIETQIVRLAQKGRACGIHLILATQRPSAEVVTGLIKANLPTKIAFTVPNAVNSKIILDEDGAEELTGKGDLLLKGTGDNAPIRLQGFYIPEEFPESEPIKAKKEKKNAK